MLTLHLNAVSEYAPRVIYPVEVPHGEPAQFREEHLSGQWLRVFPQTGMDVRFLRSTEHHLDRFAPANGPGVILATRFLAPTP